MEDIKIGMLTSRRADGHLRSRAMANQKRADGADLWFVTDAMSNKVDDIAQDPHINIAYFKPGSMEWISVSGVATLSSDRTKIAELYQPDWKMWFRDEGDARSGAPDDPRIMLIKVAIHAAEFLEVDKPKPVVVYELAKGWLTGTEPQIGHMHSL